MDLKLHKEKQTTKLKKGGLNEKGRVIEIDGINYSETQLKNIDFFGKIISHENFSKMKISNCNFFGAIFVHCWFTKTEFENCRFNNAEFLGCSFDSTKIKNCYFGYAKIFSSNFYHVKSETCLFPYSKIMDCIVIAKFENCDFTGAVMDSNFSFSTLESCNLENAKPENYKFNFTKILSTKEKQTLQGGN